MLRGEITPRICSVSLNGINSGIAKLTPLSNAIPKSIPRTSPSFLSSKKFSRCLLVAIVSIVGIVLFVIDILTPDN